jgi:hypothetical protein
MATITGFYKDNEGTVIDKDAEAQLDYQLNWSSWLPTDDTITDSSWTVETISGDADPLSITNNTFTDSVTTVTVNGGTSGNIYRLYNTIETNLSNTERRYFRIKVKDRSL